MWQPYWILFIKYQRISTVTCKYRIYSLYYNLYNTLTHVVIVFTVYSISYVLLWLGVWDNDAGWKIELKNTTSASKLSLNIGIIKDK